MAWWLSAGVAFLDSESDSDADADDDDAAPAAASESKARAANMRSSKDGAPAAAGELRGSAGGAGGAAAAAAAVVADTRAFEQAVVKCHSMTLTLINDFQGRAQPFAEVRVLNLDLEAKGWSSPFSQAALGMTLTADYFNPRVMMFEPVLEYWTFRVGQIGGGGDETKPTMRLALQSDQRLELNVSHAMIDTMLTAYSHFATSVQQERKQPQALAIAEAPAAPAPCSRRIGSRTTPAASCSMRRAPIATPARAVRAASALR
jgi:hypothetical protein